MLFGGKVNNDLSGETWEWDGNTWTQRIANGPSGRINHAMVFDSARQVVVLFGGKDREGWPYPPKRDTWEWDGTRWAQRSSSGPLQREHHAMAYDSARGVTVLYGGQDRDHIYADTWEWNGASWTLRYDGGPIGRYGHAMAYDSARGVTVLFGGCFRPPETWEWAGSGWLLVASSGPPERFEQLRPS